MSRERIVMNRETFLSRVNRVLVSMLRMVCKSVVKMVSRCPTLFFWKNAMSFCKNCPKQNVFKLNNTTSFVTAAKYLFTNINTLLAMIRVSKPATPDLSSSLVSVENL